MAEHWWWIVFALALGAAEMMVGTFYLLLIAVGCVIAALASWLGADIGVCISVAAVFSALACYGLTRYRKLHPAPGSDKFDTNNLDAGHHVMVQSWQKDGTAVVRYRGARWVAEPDIGSQQMLGLHEIVRIDNSRLVLKPKPDQANQQA